MIIEYLRPQTVEEALEYLSREFPKTYPLGGGTHLNRGGQDGIAVVDLQELKLNAIAARGKNLQVGATATLEELLNHPSTPMALSKAVKLEVTHNLRQMATIVGTLVKADGRSPTTTVLLALDASLELRELNMAPIKVKLGDWLPQRGEFKRGRLITQVSIPLNTRVAYEYVARTPADQPIVCAALAQWDSGRTRLALGGWGTAPLLALDGPEAGGIMEAARSAYSQSDDERASAQYRQEMAVILSLRCKSQIESAAYQS
jgi:putative selenate reductase FAD-binding subunit